MEEHSIALFGLGSEVATSAVGEFGSIVSIGGRDVGEGCFSPLLHVAEVHQDGGVAIASITNGFLIEEVVVVTVIFLGLFVAQHLQAFTVADREQRPSSNSAFNVGDDGVVGTAQKHAAGGTDVADGLVAFFTSDDLGTGEGGFGQADDVVTLFGGEEVVEEEDAGVLIEDLHAWEVVSRETCKIFRDPSCRIGSGGGGGEGRR